jgi:DMSO/TMAO reductase YedYZ molybdopterin-dependent catalytic subunit
VENRRQFIKKITGLLSGITVLSGVLFTFLKPLYGKSAGILSTGTNNVSGPKVRVTPLNSFGVMGATNIEIIRDEWRLDIMGKNGRSLSYTYNEILRIPSFERKVVLTCPGFFENHGLWKGLEMLRFPD